MIQEFFDENNVRHKILVDCLLIKVNIIHNRPYYIISSY